MSGAGAKFNESFANERRCFSTCAVSFATPIFHRDDKTINMTTYLQCKRQGGMRRFQEYRSSPSWGMLPGPMQSEPCWHAHAGGIADALEVASSPGVEVETSLFIGA